MKYHKSSVTFPNFNTCGCRAEVPCSAIAWDSTRASPPMPRPPCPASLLLNTTSTLLGTLSAGEPLYRVLVDLGKNCYFTFDKFTMTGLRAPLLVVYNSSRQDKPRHLGRTPASLPQLTAPISLRAPLYQCSTMGTCLGVSGT